MIEQILQLLYKILLLVQDLPERIRIAANQINVTSLSEISGTLGLVRAGEFRSGNQNDPGSGFSGVRIAYPPVYYEDNPWNIAGVLEDDLQVGINADNGKLYAANGHMVVDKNAIALSGLLYCIQHSAIQAGETRVIRIGTWPGSSAPIWGITFAGDAIGSNLVTNGGAELGDLTGWTNSGTSYIASTTLPYNGSYSIKCTEITSGTQTLTSSRIACAGGSPYSISCTTKDGSTIALYEETIPITIDSYIQSNPYHVDDNYGTEVEMIIGNDVDSVKVGRGFIKADFNVLPAGATLYDARLYLYAYNTQFLIYDTIHTLHRLKKNATEVGITWNKYDGTNVWTSAGGFSATDCEQTGVGSCVISNGLSPQWLEFYIDHSYLQEILDGTWTNNGFLLRASME